MCLSTNFHKHFHGNGELFSHRRLFNVRFASDRNSLYSDIHYIEENNHTNVWTGSLASAFPGFLDLTHFLQSEKLAQWSIKWHELWQNCLKCPVDWNFNPWHDDITWHDDVTWQHDMTTWCYMTTWHDNITWQHDMMTSHDDIIWRHHMMTSYDNITWWHHMMTHDMMTWWHDMTAGMWCRVKRRMKLDFE